MTKVEQIENAAGMLVHPNAAAFIDELDFVIRTTENQHGSFSMRAWAVFFGNILHETDYCRVIEENLRYSASRLMQVWPKRFPTKKIAAKYALNPKAIANIVYNGRMGNRRGTTDGWDYRGRGPIQLTGRNNYGRFTARTNLQVVEDPDIITEDASIFWMTAVDYFLNRKYKGKNLFELAEEGKDKLVCKLINGGYHGLADRNAKTLEFFNIATTGIEKPRNRILLKKGSRGQDVKSLQLMLRREGFKIYKIDGIFGRRTEQQVKEFQKSRNLTVDGIVGMGTFGALRLATA